MNYEKIFPLLRRRGNAPKAQSEVSQAHRAWGKVDSKMILRPVGAKRNLKMNKNRMFRIAPTARKKDF